MDCASSKCCLWGYIDFLSFLNLVLYITKTLAFMSVNAPRPNYYMVLSWLCLGYIFIYYIL